MYKFGDGLKYKEAEEWSYCQVKLLLSFGSFHGKMMYISMTTKTLMSYQTNRSLESELA